MRRLALLLLAVLVTSCATVKYPEYTRLSQAEWNHICGTLASEGLTTKRECNDLQRPIVVVTDTVEALEDWGSRLFGFYYSGEIYIFVNATEDEVQQRQTAVHEATHYVLWELYGESMSRCDSEHWARVVHHKWSDEPYDASWRNWYDCQIGYRGPL